MVCKRMQMGNGARVKHEGEKKEDVRSSARGQLDAGNRIMFSITHALPTLVSGFLSVSSQSQTSGANASTLPSFLSPLRCVYASRASPAQRVS